MKLIVHNDFPEGLLKALTEDLKEQVVTINGRDYVVDAFDKDAREYVLSPAGDDGIALPDATPIRMAFQHVHTLEIH